MKLQNVLIGVVMFSLVVGIYFAAASSIGTFYSSNNAANYQLSAQKYDVINEYSVTNQSGTPGVNYNQLQNAKDEAVTNGGYLTSTSALSAITNIPNMLITPFKLFSNFVADTGFIDPRFATALTAIIGIFSMILLLSMIWRYKPDTD